MEQNEKEIIVRCQAGDAESFGALYDSYIKKIYNFIYFKTMHKETAEDLTSLAFTRAFEKISSFNAKEGSFSSWLYAIARNAVIDHYRSQKSEKSIDDVWDLSSAEDIERDADARAQIEKVQKYLQELSGDQRDIIVMKLWQGMTHAEIAEILGKNESAVKVAYSRAMKELRANAGALAALLAFFASITR